MNRNTSKIFLGTLVTLIVVLFMFGCQSELPNDWPRTSPPTTTPTSAPAAAPEKAATTETVPVSTSEPAATATAAPVSAPAIAPTTAAASPAPSEISITITDFAFKAGSITVKKGTKVTWTNQDSVGHTVTGDGGLDSPLLSKGVTYSFTFDKEGVFNYHCTPHPIMKGTVTVTS